MNTAVFVRIVTAKSTILTHKIKGDKDRVSGLWGDSDMDVARYEMMTPRDKIVTGNSGKMSVSLDIHLRVQCPECDPTILLRRSGVWNPSRYAPIVMLG